MTYGIGAFEDFRTKAEAERFAAKRRREETGDWAARVSDPFNAVEHA